MHVNTSNATTKNQSTCGFFGEFNCFGQSTILKHSSVVAVVSLVTYVHDIIKVTTQNHIGPCLFFLCVCVCVCVCMCVCVCVCIQYETNKPVST